MSQNFKNWPILTGLVLATVPIVLMYSYLVLDTVTDNSSAEITRIKGASSLGSTNTQLRFIAASSGGKQLETFTTVTGLTVQEFQSLARENPAQVLNIFVQELARISKEGGNCKPVKWDVKDSTSTTESGLTLNTTRDSKIYEIDHPPWS